MCTAVSGKNVNKTKNCSFWKRVMLTKLRTVVSGKNVNKTKNCSFWESNVNKNKSCSFWEECKQN